jgi:hypothetical protein
VARHGHLGAMREAMLQREDLPAAIRQALVAKLSQTLADFVSSNAGCNYWIIAAARSPTHVPLPATGKPRWRVISASLAPPGAFGAL